MAELTNPLFEDEKEFLERQKQEYERALIGEVEEIKEKSQQVGKYVAIGAGVAGGIWLLTKAFGGKKKKKASQAELDAWDELGQKEEGHHPRTRRTMQALHRNHASTQPDRAYGDDLGFGSTQTYRGPQKHSHERAHIAPDVYHASAPANEPDPFQPLGFDSPAQVPARQYKQRTQTTDETGSSIMADAFRAFLQSDTGKLLVAQATAVLMAVVAKKMGDFLPVIKNPDLASSPAQEPETKDIEYTFHDDDANAPHQPL